MFSVQCGLRPRLLVIGYLPGTVIAQRSLVLGWLSGSWPEFSELLEVLGCIGIVLVLSEAVLVVVLENSIEDEDRSALPR